LRELDSLLKRQNNYRAFFLTQGEKKRPVEAPKPIIERVHRRLFQLLTRITPPEYLHSGVRGRSYVSNAEQHRKNPVLYKLDIVKFYPSTKQWHAFEFFRSTMKCSRDVAGLLAKIVTVDGHLPTGSCLSQIMAFYAHFDMFEALYGLATSYNLVMTCYVDDIVFSGNKIPKSFQLEAKKIIQSSGLLSHPRKEKLFFGEKPRIVTGVVISQSQLKIPNRQHLMIKEALFELPTLVADSPEREKLYRQVVGRIVSASQIEPKFFKHKKVK